jgi:hypothetical protein
VGWGKSYLKTKYQFACLPETEMCLVQGSGLSADDDDDDDDDDDGEAASRFRGRKHVEQQHYTPRQRTP